MIFKSKCDGLELDCLIMEPDSIHGIFQIAHGMAEHKERYIGFMEYLCENGYLVVINDHRGHGKSVKNPDDLGYFYDETGKFIVEDIHDIGMYFKDRNPGVPYILFGHSMGSLIVRNVLKLYDKDIDKLIVCGSPSKNPATPLALGLAKTIKATKGERHRSTFLTNLALGAYEKRFDEGVKNTWLSVNRENVEAYNASNLCGFTFTINGYLNLFHLMKEVYDENGWKKEHLDCPIYFIAGEFDPCIESYDKWKEAQAFLQKIGYKKIQNTLYKNMRHEILLEDNHISVYQDILNFIN